MLFITESTQALLYMSLKCQQIPQDKGIIKKIQAIQNKAQRFTG